jgi:fatty acid desaturase
MYAFLLFVAGGFSKGPLRALKKRRWNLALGAIALYHFGAVRTGVLYGLTGMLFLSIAQLSHIQHECIQPHAEHKNDFLYNQVSSSINYRTDDPITRCLCFGLDIQIEHHLFPHIPHSSLRRIQHVVRRYCEQHDVPYVEKPSVFHALCSYLRYLYRMGRP